MIAFTMLDNGSLFDLIVMPGVLLALAPFAWKGATAAMRKAEGDR